MDRRTFIQQGAAGLSAMGLWAGFPNTARAPGRRVKVPVGFQSFVLRNEISKQPTEVMTRMASYGYEQVEMCSPSGYRMAGFAPLAKYSGKELKKIIEDTGLTCISSHFTLGEMTTNLDERIAFAQDLGLKYFVCSGGLVSPTLDEVKKKCAQMNAMGEKIARAGMIAGYHNHNGEFEEKLDGRPQYDIMLDELDGNLVKMQFQVAAIQVGYKAADYFRKFPGRFISAHLQDYSTNDKNKQVVLGQGIVDWNDFFVAAKTGGLKVVYVEMESDPATLKDSAAYLRNL
ncbi:MAG: hypothetical protein RL732_478 [Bacteroidota bacterium]